MEKPFYQYRECCFVDYLQDHRGIIGVPIGHYSRKRLREALQEEADRDIEVCEAGLDDAIADAKAVPRVRYRDSAGRFLPNPEDMELPTLWFQEAT